MKDLKLNDGIKEKEIRLIHDGENSVVKTADALAMAMERELDLVMISPDAKPPVCKIMDYSKFAYEQSKKQKEMRKSQKTINLKEIRLSPTIEDNDIQVKANHAIKFLSSGDKVKVTIRFRGRQLNNMGSASKVFDAFMAKLGDIAIVEKAPQQEGKNLFMILAPKKEKAN